MRVLKLITLLMLLSHINVVYAAELTEGSKYKVIQPIYLIGEYNDRGNKKISQSTAKAYLEATNRAKMSYTAFRSKVPKGTTVTIVQSLKKPWYLYFQGDLYLVKLNTDLSQGLDIILQIDTGMEGSLDGKLNPNIFEPVN